MTIALFLDPKPRQLHRAASISARRPWFGMKSRSHAGSDSVWLIVGGARHIPSKTRAAAKRDLTQRAAELLEHSSRLRPTDTGRELLEAV